MALTPADAETIERALTRVLGYVDPVAHALATKAAARDETTIAAALKNVLGLEDARAVQEAVQNRQGPSDEEESSSDDEQIDAPAWASQRDLDEAIASFDAWVQPDETERRRADDLFARITQTIKEVDPFARVELRGSRASRCALFDADVDVVVEDINLEAVAEALVEAEWSRGAELIRARVPIVTGKDATTKLAFDVATTRDAVRQSQHAYGSDLNDSLFSQDRPPHFAATVRLCKVVLRQTGLGGAYGGGLGSFALCALVFDILRRASHGTPAGAALGALRGLGSVHTYARPVHLGAAVVDVNLDDPAALAAAFMRAADAPTLGAMLDVPGLARTRRRFRRRGDDRAAAVPSPNRGVKRPRAS
jgi:hypothetical protein